MKKYEFRLQRVKRVRAVEEELARAQFGVAHALASDAERRADERKFAIDRAVDDLRGLQGTPILSPASVITALSLIDDSRAAWRLADEAARGLRAKAEETRLAWQDRKRALEGLERLDERSHTAFIYERERVETLELDETAMQRDARARRTSSAVEGR